MFEELPPALSATDPDSLVPVHPEAVDTDERVLRWRTPAGVLTFVGTVAAAPGELGALLEDSVLESMTAEPDAVHMRLAPDRDWRTEGTRVRRALQSALRTPEQWIPGAGAGTEDDDLLRGAVRQVLAGEVGDYVRSHGGEITLLAAAEGRVELRMSGACSHCPATDHTLGNRVETAVRELYPGLRGVSAVSDPGPRRLLGLSPLRRR